MAADEKPEIESENIVPGVKGIKQLPKSLNPQQSPSKIPIAKLSGSKPSPIKIKDSKSKIASNSVLKQAATN